MTNPTPFPLAKAVGQQMPEQRLMCRKEGGKEKPKPEARASELWCWNYLATWQKG